MTTLWLYTHLPVAKKVWQFHTVATRFLIDDVVDIAVNTMDITLEKMMELRSRSPRAFKGMPPYIKFHIQVNGNPQYQPGRKIGEFNIYLNDMTVEIVKPWNR